MPPATLKMPGDRPRGHASRHGQRARLFGFVTRSAVELDDRLTVLAVAERGGADPRDVRAVRAAVLVLHGRPLGQG